MLHQDFFRAFIRSNSHCYCVKPQSFFGKILENVYLGNMSPGVSLSPRTSTIKMMRTSSFFIRSSITFMDALFNITNHWMMAWDLQCGISNSMICNSSAKLPRNGQQILLLLTEMTTGMGNNLFNVINIQQRRKRFIWSQKVEAKQEDINHLRCHNKYTSNKNKNHSIL